MAAQMPRESYIHPSPIRITVTQKTKSPGDPRLAFWRPILAHRDVVEKMISEHLSDSENQTLNVKHLSEDEKISKLEGILVKKWREDVRSAIKRKLDDALKDFREVYMRDARDRPERSDELGQPSVEAIRQQMRQTPEYADLIHKYSLLSRMDFSVQLEPYSSLNISLLFSSVKALLEIFDNEPGALHFLLAGFAPMAFTALFGENIAGKMSFNVDVPSSYTASNPGSAGLPPNTAAQGVRNDSGQQDQTNSAMRRMQWWALILNTSLLVPVAILIYTLIVAFNQVQSMQNTQRDALKPIIDQQAELLKEDRERLTTTGKLEDVILQNLTQQAINTIAVTPTATKFASPTGLYHTVKPGETLFSIGRQYGLSPSTIAAANGLSNPNRILPGMRLFIPISNPTP